jgi:hypothetical protein
MISYKAFFTGVLACVVVGTFVIRRRRRPLTPSKAAKEEDESSQLLHLISQDNSRKGFFLFSDKKMRSFIEVSRVITVLALLLEVYDSNVPIAQTLTSVSNVKN